ncbi:MAG: hypothetical protein RIS58_757 [Actinomycetota bacterium]
MKWSAELICELTQQSLENANHSDLAYLALTGKIELPVRDALGAHISRRWPELTAAREYKRRDLVVLQDARPLAAIEGKMWISFEANFPKKLHHKNPKEGLVAASLSDMKKLRTLAKGSSCVIFTSTVLVGADLGQLDPRHKFAIKYARWHRRGPCNEENLMQAHDRGVSTYRDAMTQYGLASSARLFSGVAFGAPVVGDVVICQIDP